MKIIVNGAQKEVVDTYTVQNLLAEMEIIGQRLAVEVNEEIVSKSRHSEYSFTDGDKVEIVHAIGGG